MGLYIHVYTDYAVILFNIPWLYSSVQINKLKGEGMDRIEEGRGVRGEGGRGEGG